MGREEDVKKEIDFLVSCGRDLGTFISWFFSLSHKTPEFHKEIHALLQKEERLALAAPRGFAKSTIVAKFYPLWLALYQKKKDICIISASEGLATEHLRFIKQELESNQKILYFFGSLKSEKWTETHLILQHANGVRVNIRAKGAGGQIRGFRPDCIILDDIETDESVESEEQRKKLKDWLFKACLNTLLPGGQFLLIGTVLHPLSVLADLLGTPNGFTQKKYTAYKNGIEREGHELWPELWDHKALQRRKLEIGSFRFAAEYMNDPKSDSAASIKEDQIRYWTELPTQLSCVIAIDPAYSEDESSDYKVAVVVGIDTNSNRYLLDYIRTHDPSGEFKDSVINLYLKYKHMLTSVGCPKGSGDLEFFNGLVEKSMIRKISLPLVELSNTFTDGTGNAVRKKVRRVVSALQWLFEQGKYYINSNHFEAREELLTIGSSRWDDVVDAMAYAEQILTPMFAEVGSKKEQPSMLGKSSGYGIEY